LTIEILEIIEIIEIDNVWDKKIRKLCEKYNKQMRKNNLKEIPEIINELIAYLRIYDIEQNKEQKNYVVRWAASKALKEIAFKHPEHLSDYIHDLEYLSQYGNSLNIQERASQVLETLNKTILKTPKKRVKRKKTKKIGKDKIRELQNLLKLVDEISIKEIAKKFNNSVESTKSWLYELLEDGIINGEISGAMLIPLKKVDYQSLEEYQPESGNQCAICYQIIETQEPSFCPSCNSFFHKDCILEYAKKYKRCPVCSETLRWI